MFYTSNLHYFLTFFLNFLDTNFLLSLCETENKNEWFLCFMASLNKLFKATVSLSTSTQNENEEKRAKQRNWQFFSANLFPKKKMNFKQFKAIQGNVDTSSLSRVAISRLCMRFPNCLAFS